MLEYVVRAFGNGHVTGVVAWLLLATNAIIIAMVAVSFGSYASAAFADGGATWTKIFAALVVAGYTLNIGLAGGGTAQTIVVFVVVGILTVFAIATLANLDTSLLAFSGYLSLRDGVERRAYLLRLLGFVNNAHGEGPGETPPASRVPFTPALGIATWSTSPWHWASLDAHRRRGGHLGGTALAVAAQPVLGDAGYWLMSVTALSATAGAMNATTRPQAVRAHGLGRAVPAGAG